MADSWTRVIVGQLDFYMAAHLLPRLEGLSDHEYFWEPISGAWSLVSDASGALRIESSWPEPEPDPAPVTTIAWRLAHVGVSNLGTRVSAFFGDGSVPDDADMFDERHVLPVPATAAEAISVLEEMHARWRDGLLSLDDERLAAPVGPKGGPYAEDPLAALVLHVSRETMHHGGEIGVLRDLYRRQFVI